MRARHAAIIIVVAGACGGESMVRNAEPGGTAGTGATSGAGGSTTGVGGSTAGTGLLPGGGRAPAAGIGGMVPAGGTGGATPNGGMGAIGKGGSGGVGGDSGGGIAEGGAQTDPGGSGGDAGDSAGDDCDSRRILYGNIDRPTQAELEAAYDGVYAVMGSVWFELPGVVDLSPLRCLTTISGELSFADMTLDSFAGLDRLSSVGGRLYVEVLNVRDFEPLRNLRSVGGLVILYNYSLESLDGLAGIERISGPVEIRGNEWLPPCGPEMLINGIGATNIEGPITLVGNGPCVGN